MFYAAEDKQDHTNNIVRGTRTITYNIGLNKRGFCRDYFQGKDQCCESDKFVRGHAGKGG